MKTFIPRHIQGGLFNVTLPIGPLNITVVQLFIIAGGTALSLIIRNSLVKKGIDKIIAFMFVLPIMIIFLFIAFFKFSELGLLAFLSKIFKTYIFDETQKYNINYNKIDPLQIKIKRMKSEEKKQIIEIKEGKIDSQKIDKLKNFIE